METDPHLPYTAAPPSTNTIMSQWHDWYEGNCAFCSNPGHMQRIKYSSSQNLLLVNELLIQASSSHLYLPTAVSDTHWRAHTHTLTHTEIHTSLCNTQSLPVYLSLFTIAQSLHLHLSSTVFSFYFIRALSHSPPEVISLYLFTHTHKITQSINGSCDHWSVPAAWAVNNPYDQGLYSVCMCV